MKYVSSASVLFVVHPLVFEVFEICSEGVTMDFVVDLVHQYEKRKRY